MDGLQGKLQNQAYGFAYILVQCLGNFSRLRPFLHANGAGAMLSFVKPVYASMKRYLKDHLGRSGFIEQKGHALG